MFSCFRQHHVTLLPCAGGSDWNPYFYATGDKTGKGGKLILIDDADVTSNPRYELLAPQPPDTTATEHDSDAVNETYVEPEEYQPSRTGDYLEPITAPSTGEEYMQPQPLLVEYQEPAAQPSIHNTLAASDYQEPIAGSEYQEPIAVELREAADDDDDDDVAVNTETKHDYDHPTAVLQLGGQDPEAYDEQDLIVDEV